MSATGRGSPRVDYDFYATPASAVSQLLRATVLPGGAWLEPGAGNGAIIRAVNAHRNDVVWSAVEIQPRFERGLKKLVDGNLWICDFRKGRGLPKFNVVMGNPPFTYAADFVHRSLQYAPTVFMLLRLNWLGSSAKRRWLFESCGVPSLYILEQRPSFKNGETDACDYAWMRWHSDGSQRRDVTILRGDR